MKRMLVAVLVGLCGNMAHAVDDVALQALFKDKAIIVIDGTRRVLSVGEISEEGIRLIATDTAAEQAQVEIDGKREIIKLGMVISGFQPAKQASVTLWAGSGGHFFADGTINGLTVRFLVDTGATTIAISGDEATRLGIDYRKVGRPGYANTAGGVVRSYSLKLDKVEIGAITLYGVDAGVVEGSFPREPLLGMSFLGRLDMKREGDHMELTQR
jgi:aspartyl protease family protein